MFRPRKHACLGLAGRKHACLGLVCLGLAGRKHACLGLVGSGLLVSWLWLAPLHAAGGEILGGLLRFETAPASPLDPSATHPELLTYGFGAGDWSTPALEPSMHQALNPPGYHGPEVYYHQSDPNDPSRHIGRGVPLYGTSWLNRPLHAGWFIGGLMGDELIADRVDQLDDLFGGYRVGWDWDHYWGSEVRLGFARPDLADSLSDELTRISRNWFLDAHLAYYPWGDAQWRPYLSAGMGIATFRFLDEELDEHHDTLFHMPLGIGVKYLADRWLAVRMELTDNIAFGSSGLETMHNVTYTFGIEARFGSGSHRKYFPY